VALERALAELPEGCARWLADLEGARAADTAPEGAPPATGLIGPSGGLDGEEREAALRAGFRTIRLSEARLRTETAAVAWAAWWASGAPGEPARP
jgi:16S rRNA U1498 N3-methylase RsmE